MTTPKINLPVHRFDVYARRKLMPDGTAERVVSLRLRSDDPGASGGFVLVEVTPQDRGQDWLAITHIQRSLRAPMLRSLDAIIERADILSARMCGSLYRHEMPSGWYSTLLSLSIELQPWPLMTTARLQLADEGAMAQLRGWVKSRTGVGAASDMMKIDGPVAVRGRHPLWSGALADLGRQYDQQVRDFLGQTLDQMDGVRI